MIQGNHKNGVRFVWRTDVHMADKGPASRKDDWPTTVLGKLEQTRLVAAKTKADALLDGGDFFHVKSPSRNTHALTRRVADHHSNYPCPVYCTPGNHDSVFGDYQFLGRQPLGVLYSTGVFNRLYDEHELVVVSADGNFKVRVVGIPYHGVKYDMERFHRITKGDEDFLIVVAHVLASVHGGQMFKDEDIVKYSDLEHHPADMFLFGHWHKDQGVEHLWGKHFVNIGSLTRGALTEDNLDRKPACAVLTITPDGAAVQVVRLKVQPGEEVFDVQRRMQVEARSATMDHFIDTMKDTLVHASEKDVEETVADMEDVPQIVRERWNYYWEQVD